MLSNAEILKAALALIFAAALAGFLWELLDVFDAALRRGKSGHRSR